MCKANMFWYGQVSFLEDKYAALTYPNQAIAVWKHPSVSIYFMHHQFHPIFSISVSNSSLNIATSHHFLRCAPPPLPRHKRVEDCLKKSCPEGAKAKKRLYSSWEVPAFVQFVDGLSNRLPLSGSLKCHVTFLQFLKQHKKACRMMSGTYTHHLAHRILDPCPTILVSHGRHAPSIPPSIFSAPCGRTWPVLRTNWRWSASRSAPESWVSPTAPGAVGDGHPGWWGETWCFTSLKPPIQGKPLVDVATKVPKWAVQIAEK